VDVVRAAGGVVARDGKVLLVHRPKYDDWTFPKGKAEEGESDEDCAVREVEEETGFRCSLERELPSTSYRDSHGRPKHVRYWLMERREGSFEPTDEVDEIAWVSPADAARKLTYARDQAVLGSL
jgi:8-oxo-dGTP pyrophosphatase MutT (NUDIX family)